MTGRLDLGFASFSFSTCFFECSMFVCFIVFSYVFFFFLNDLFGWMLNSLHRIVAVCLFCGVFVWQLFLFRCWILPCFCVCFVVLQLTLFCCGVLPRTGCVLPAFQAVYFYWRFSLVVYT